MEIKRLREKGHRITLLNETQFWRLGSTPAADDHQLRRVRPEASSRTRCPVFRIRVASFTFASAGKPYSRAIVDACDSMPPTSTMTPEASVNSGVHDGSVAGRHQNRAALHRRELARIAHHDHLRFDRARADAQAGQYCLSPCLARDRARGEQRRQLGLPHQQRQLQIALRVQLRRAARGDRRKPPAASKDRAPPASLRPDCSRK